MKNNEHSKNKSDKDRIVFDIGKIYLRQQELHDMFGGNRRSGIAPCAKHPCVFLFTSQSGGEFGYEDGWISDEIYAYTGEGQVGNMEMTRGNRAIQDHQEYGRALHLFKKIKTGKYEYIGRFVYITHEITTGTDIENNQRTVIRFILKRIDD